MEARRLLLIDDDPKFTDLVSSHLNPYGFEVVVASNGDNPLGQVKVVKPELIMIAVELPDKTGYALCNKAKKGVAKKIPVVLTTSSVPPAGFKSHRRLKNHADEYLDKRTLSSEELMDKVDLLVGLGELVAPGGAPQSFDAVPVEPPPLAPPPLPETDSDGSIELDLDDEFDVVEEVEVDEDFAAEFGSDDTNLTPISLLRTSTKRPTPHSTRSKWAGTMHRVPRRNQHLSLRKRKSPR